MLAINSLCVSSAIQSQVNFDISNYEFYFETIAIQWPAATKKALIFSNVKLFFKVHEAISNHILLFEKHIYHIFKMRAAYTTNPIFEDFSVKLVLQFFCLHRIFGACIVVGATTFCNRFQSLS